VDEVVVVTGTGGMGVACARRLGAGRALVLADLDQATLDAQAAALVQDGFAVTAVQVDVSERGAVRRLADVAAERGPIRTVVHTAGLSPAQATPERLLTVDVLGTEYVLDAFLGCVDAGTVAVCIASMAGYLASIAADFEQQLSSADVADLPGLLHRARDLAHGDAYAFAKRVNQLRVEHYAAAWGARGGRVVSISPGIISTPMGRQELAGAPEAIGATLELSPVPRIGTPEDIANAVAWLASPEASFVSGCDLRVDGGVIAAVRGLAAGTNPLTPREHA
jgi:NAD(P)-dependent dehydrogenase (short-subunit alcohol dehydrogenase family)